MPMCKNGKAPPHIGREHGRGREAGSRQGPGREQVAGSRQVAAREAGGI